MAEARCRQQWDHTSFLLAMMHNRTPGLKREDMKKPADFNPYATPSEDDNDLEVPFDTLKVLMAIPPS